jgi:3-oxoacyl-[acyl-carrier protein] reductase
MKRALVTGGSGTIGKVICRALAQQDIHVIVHANIHQDAAKETVRHIKETGGSAEDVFFDLCDLEATGQAIDGIVKEGPIQILINNAGVHDDAPLAGMSPRQWKHIIDLSLHGFFNVTQPLLLPMIRTRWGRIITISSLSGIIGVRGQTNYAAAKAGLHGASKSLALEVASRGITVNVVAPGLIDSPAIEKVFSREQIEALVPMKRAGTPAEVADLVAFLASEKADYISGQIIGINGAMA